ncbi:MAG: archease [Chloroflexota bacterium]|nr:archease [Chloroflexota bacterium]
MKSGFEIIDHTADVAIAAYGADLKEAFANAACGLFSIITNIDEVREATRRDVEVNADDKKDLLVSWLNELIYIYEVERLLFKRFDIADLGETKLKAYCYGEAIDPKRHEIRGEIKAATYHMLKIEEGDSVRVQVLFDI